MKIVLTSHGNFCTGLLESCKMIAGETVDKIRTVKMDDVGIGKFSKELNDLLDELIKEDKVLVLCDLKGGTPYNESFNYFLRHSEDVRVVCGMNLPMVIETILQLDAGHDLSKLAGIAVDAGRNAVEMAVADNNNDDGELDF